VTAPAGFDPAAARTLQEEGMAQAEKHTDAEWRAACDEAIKMAAATGLPFQAADLVAAAIIAEPRHPNHWGPRFAAAHRAGLIESVGATESKRSSVRNSLCKVWKGTVPLRVLVTGSRDWPEPLTVHNALSAALEEHKPRPLTVVHGACPTGADEHAHQWVAAARLAGHHVTEEQHPADWVQHGNAAGPIRNTQMVRAGATMCLAFVKDASRGASSCAAAAEAAGIATRRWTA
jgi:hypothetical protein